MPQTFTVAPDPLLNVPETVYCLIALHATAPPPPIPLHVQLNVPSFPLVSFGVTLIPKSLQKPPTGYANLGSPFAVPQAPTIEQLRVALQLALSDPVLPRQVQCSVPPQAAVVYPVAVPAAHVFAT